MTTLVRHQVIDLDASLIVDEASFHRVFAQTLQFHDGYGANWDAWLDAMTFLDEGGVRPLMVTLHILDAAGFRRRLPQLFLELQLQVAFVNWRRLAQGLAPMLALAFAVEPEIDSDM